MVIVIVLISVSLTIALLFLGLFLWNMKSGQYDDVYTPSVRMLFEDQNSRSKSSANRPDKNQDHTKV